MSRFTSLSFLPALLLTSMVHAGNIPNISDTWNFTGTFLLQPLHEESKGDLTKSTAVHKYPIKIEQHQMFFRMTFSRDKMLVGSHDPNKAKPEQWFCVIDPTQNNQIFYCTDADEPVKIRGRISNNNKLIEMIYVESGVKTQKHVNKFAIGTLVGTRP